MNMNPTGTRKKNWNTNPNNSTLDQRSNNAPSRSFKNRGETSSYMFSVRNHPINKRELQNLVENESHVIPVTLLNEASGYRLFLNELNIESYMLCLVIKAIHKSLDNKLYIDGIRDLLLLTFTNSKFLQNLSQFISDSKYEGEIFIEYVPLICEIIIKFFHLSPENAFPVASGFVDTCTGVIQYIKAEDKLDVNDIEQSLNILVLNIKENRKSYVRYKSNTTESPPNDFRELDVVPTSAELNAVTRPFIRPNIIDGGYEHSDHYLDVQFRLLKEDFMRPLREGLKSYRTDFSRNSDVRVYSNFSLCSTGIEQTEFVYYFKINTKKQALFNTSKRFMFGNIICISDDNFNTVITASVFNTDKINEKIVGVKLETDSHTIQYDKIYVAIESKAYFVSYKHTLKALQNLKKVPFENYTVFVKEENRKPQYILQYRLNQLREKNEFNWVSEPYESEDDSENSDWGTLNDTTSNNEDKVAVNRNKKETYESLSNNTLLKNFNLSLSQLQISNLKMDESQLRALHAALNSQVALIQGPPGTGKTFLGLKITKILLQLKKLWSENDSHPILVVCYTNHALDQFLEGMIKFTDKIIRVGSRSKSEILSKYEIKNCVFEAKGQKDDNPISNMYHVNRFEIRSCRTRMNNITNIINEINDFCIVDLLSFMNDFNILPSHVVNVLRKLDMKRFLQDKYIHQKTKEPNNDIKISSIVNQVSNNDQSPSAAEELLKAEENERILDDLVDDDYDYTEREKDENEAGENLPHFKTLITLHQQRKTLTDLYSLDNIKFSEIKKREEEITIMIEMLKQIHEVEVKEYECIKLERSFEISKLDFKERAMLYRYWKKKLLSVYEKLKSETEKEFMNLQGKLLSLRQLAYLNQMKKADIVGMTTTGAARYCDLLYDLAPPIVIVEEAAEILEAHVISCLSSKCQHLIMIGDHQQLRPKTTVYELCKKYNFDTSLFERLINNGINYETLEYQHRMKPIISDLLVPTFYETLKDHPSVLQYPKIKGIKEDLFFINHNHHEKKPSSDMESFENIHEAKFLIGLATHLIHQGYSQEDITIITPYSGQFRCLREFQKKEDLIQNVPINVLDNFQGEESNIILLSLVRSNEEEKVGFMKIDNRICVAISRAKHGMYIIGNMNQMMKSSSIWSQINEKLTDKNCIGYKLRLECQNHPEVSITVSTYKEFTEESPEGGCNQPCSNIFPKCGHACPRYCHPDDPDHIITKCKMACPKFLCEFNHTQCMKLCHENCPKCVFLVKKRFSCGHSHNLECNVDPNKVKCTTIIDKILECNHLAKHVRCHEDVSEYVCKKSCLKILKCDHPCQKRCHKKPSVPLFLSFRMNMKETESCPECQMLVEKELPCGHKQKMKCNIDPKDFKCLEKVNKKLPCEHEVNDECHVDVSSLKCNAKCSESLKCGHTCIEYCHRLTDPTHENYACKRRCLKFPFNCNIHKCKKVCYKDCGNCTEKIDWNLNCGHIVKAECSSIKDEIICSDKCRRILPCGHPCPRTCGEDCGGCKMPVIVVKQKCGHTINNIPCGTREKDIICEWICNELLICNHLCRKLCGEKCGNCKVPVEKEIPECSHVCMVPCEYEPSRKFCTLPCKLKLSCGHLCRKRCQDSCTEKCLKMVTTNIKCPQGHSKNVPCHEVEYIKFNGTNYYVNDVSEQGFSLLGDYTKLICEEVCGKIMDCGHRCQNICGKCFSGRLHIPCTRSCNKILACGHKCKAKCYVECPPCNENCSMKCSHSNCKNKCGDSCTFCNNNCTYLCEHTTCTVRCGGRCNRKPCNKSCSQKITKCGHPCVGFCGEPCPPLCKICDQETIQEIIVGDIKIDNARFIMLEDCKHVFEANFLDKWMSTNSSKEVADNEAKIKTCPVCSLPIYNTRRYKYIIWSIYKQVSTRNNIHTKLINQERLRKELNELLEVWPDEANIIRENLGFDPTISISSKKRYLKSSLLDLYNCQIDILKQGAKMSEKLNHKTELKILIKLVMNYEGKMTPEIRDHFFYELKRLRNCDMLLNMKKKQNKIEVKNLLSTIENIMHPAVVFSKEIEEQVRKLFDDAWLIIRRNQNAGYNRGNQNRRGGYNRGQSRNTSRGRHY